MHRSPHDALFKAVFSSPTRAAELLRSLLPPALTRRIEWASLRLCAGSFVDKSLRSQHSDLLFTARCGDREIHLYILLEHKSFPDGWVGLALYRYMGEIWDRHVTAEKSTHALPAILPVVIYHSQHRWTVATEFSQTVDIPPEAELLRTFTPKFRFLLVDLASADPAEMQALAVSPDTQLVIRALKEVRAAPDIGSMLRGWIGLVEAIWRDPARVDIIPKIFHYIHALRPRELEALDLENLGNHGKGETIMARLLGDYFDGMQEAEQRGEQRGEQRRAHQLLLRQLRLKFSAVPPAVVSRIEAADEKSLERWIDRILFAGSLEEVFAEAKG